MSDKDTEKLLRQCSTGLKMGVTAIDETVSMVKSTDLKNTLQESKTDHVQLSNEADELLSEISVESAEPGAIAKGMSWFKTHLMITMVPTDSTVAELITDGCNMGIKTINKTLNDCENADDKSKKIAQKLIELDKKLALDVSPYL